MKAEIDVLEQNSTWTIEDLPPGKKLIGSKWVYKIKYNSDGTIKRLKARVVVRGDTQTKGIDYSETFALVAKLVSVRMFLAVAVIKGWDSIKWTLTMLFSTTIFMKKFTCGLHRDSLLLILIKSAGSASHYMVFDSLPAIDLLNWKIHFGPMGFANLMPIIPSSPTTKMRFSFQSWFMWMI